MNTLYHLTKTIVLSGRTILPAILLIMSFLFLPATSIAAAEQKRDSDPAYVFYKGNSYYEDGQYNEAIEEYIKLPAMGMESGNLYYNLGNSYFKKGELGKAILYYERAKRLIPRDSDLKSNYNFSVSLIKYSRSGETTLWSRTALPIFDFLTINEITMLLSFLFVLAVLFLMIRMFVPASRKLMIFLVSFSLIIIILLSISLSDKISLSNKDSIVLSESTEARFEPIESATTHFTLYEGMKIQLIHSKEEWNKIKRPDGKIGWIRARDMEKI